MSGGANVNARALAVFLGVVFVVTNGLGQESSLPQPYTDKDAYQIYDLLIPSEETWCTKTWVIQQETELWERDLSRLDRCVSPTSVHEFQDAIVSFKAANNRRWLLERQFGLDRPYELVRSDSIAAFFKGREQNRAESDPPLADGWEGFYQRYPGSGGYIILSAVGFNKDKTRAVVYSGAGCGSLCGAWSFHLFKKMNGKWTEVPGIMCRTIS
jgi:hypothetical protein